MNDVTQLFSCNRITLPNYESIIIIQNLRAIYEILSGVQHFIKLVCSCKSMINIVKSDFNATYKLYFHLAADAIK